MAISDPGDGRRWTLYLSGGGVRAALAAVGAIYFLVVEGMWPAVKRVVSVSGGGLVNSWLMTRRPSDSEVTHELRAIFGLLTDRRRSLALVLGVVGITIGFAAVSIVWLAQVTAPGIRGWVIAVAVLIWIAIGLQVSTRIWLRWFFMKFGRQQRLGSALGTDWRRLHVFATTDIGAAGSLFFESSPAVCLSVSDRRGVFDARDVSITKVLRSTTAFPPAFPPARYQPKKPPPGAGPDWTWQPTADGIRAAWLADGGVTGNLGVQYGLGTTESARSALAIAAARARISPTAHNCSVHPNFVAWLCEACQQRMIVVDASGATPRLSRMVGALIAIPGVGIVYHALRSLRVMYESHLQFDTTTAGTGLISTVRVPALLDAIAAARTPDVDRSDQNALSLRGGMFRQWRHLTVEFPEQLFTTLEWACIRARIGTLKVPTGLLALRRDTAMTVVASGFLNACLAMKGRDAMEDAGDGIARLDQQFELNGELHRWWVRVCAEFDDGTTEERRHRLRGVLSEAMGLSPAASPES